MTSTTANNINTTKTRKTHIVVPKELWLKILSFVEHYGDIFHTCCLCKYMFKHVFIRELSNLNHTFWRTRLVRQSFKQRFEHLQIATSDCKNFEQVLPKHLSFFALVRMQKLPYLLLGSSAQHLIHLSTELKHFGKLDRVSIWNTTINTCVPTLEQLQYYRYIHMRSIIAIVPFCLLVTTTCFNRNCKQTNLVTHYTAMSIRVVVLSFAHFPIAAIWHLDL